MGDMDKAGEQADILSAKNSSALASDLRNYIYQVSVPKIFLAYI
jgi:hypothetical protein